MKKTQIGLGVLALVLLMVLVFVGCGSDGADGGGGSTSRTPVRDGTYHTTGFGNNTIEPIKVTTTFASNTIVRISIGENGETVPILDTVRSLLIPRIIQAQSIGVDSISGATNSSNGVKSAVAEAIKQANGNPDEWKIAPPRSDKRVALPNDGGAPYDVIVVGLGGAGMAAYVSAAEETGATVFGIEVAGKIGGNSATAGGPYSINSEYIANLYNIPDYAGADGVEFQVNSFRADYGNIDPYSVDSKSGGAKMNIVEFFVKESGKTVSWLGQNYSFNFERPSALGGRAVVTNYGSDIWLPEQVSPWGTTPAGYASDDVNDLHKTTMFTRAVESAKAKNPRNDYMLELRATKILTDAGKITGVEATYRDGSTYVISGKTVVLATGGFIGNAQMMETNFGVRLMPSAVVTERGDGIRMATETLNANTYNIKMPGAVHIAQLRNIVPERINNPAVTSQTIDGQWKQTLTSLLLKGNNLIVALKPGQAGNFVGKRFTAEGGVGFGPAFDNWRAGGYYAAIYSNDELYKLKTTAPGLTGGSTAWYSHPQGEPLPANQPITFIKPLIDWAESVGNVYKASTIADLAGMLGVDPATLAATITEYNGYVNQAKTDDTFVDPVWGKPAHSPPSFFAPEQYLFTMPITENCPTGYTAILGAGYYYGTCGGLDVDVDMQVLNTSKAKIPGLYAAGQDSSGVLFRPDKAYATYGGVAQGWAITSGRWAGKNAAKEAKR